MRKKLDRGQAKSLANLFFCSQHLVFALLLGCALARPDESIAVALATNQIVEDNPSYAYEYKVADNEAQVYHQHQQNMENQASKLADNAGLCRHTI